LIFDAKIENIIFVSSGYERIRGKSMEDFIKKPFFQFEEVYPEDLNRVLASYQNHKNGKSEPIEYRVKFLDGSIRWIEAQGFPVRNDFGEIINNISVIRDITERKQAEENLSSERDFSDVALNSLPAIFTLNDSTGKYLRWNKNFETITGYSAEEIISLHPSELVIGSVNASVRERIKLVFEQGFADSEGDLICKNGKTIPYHFTGRPFYYKDIQCVISIGIDISERKKNALALQLEKDTVQKYLDIAGVMIVVANADLEIVLVNKKASEVIGYEEKEIIGRNAVEILIPEEERHKEESFVQKMITGEIKATGADKSQTTVLTKKGEKKVIEWSGVPLIDETGKITGIIASGEDVTERIKMQNMLSQAKNEWEETFDTINDAITIHDNKHNIIRANKTASKLLGRSFNDIIKFKCFELYHGSDSPMPSCPCHISLKTGEISVQRTFEPHLNRHLEIKAIPRFDKNNQPVGVVHIVRDISDQMKAEEEQRLLQSQFLHIQKMESIGRLAGGVAHDFNNILSGILGFSELALLDIPKDDPLRERIELIMGLGEKAGSLTHQLLAFSRKQKLVMKDINLNNVVIDMVRMLKRIIGEDIKLELRPCVAIRDVLADQGQMEQVLLNLAVNARDAMPYGGVLTIETTDTVLNEENIKKHEGADPGEYVKLTVSDTGCGMSSKVLENIFEPFYTTKEIGKGTGLGLATVYGIIKQHRGYIEVTSKPEEGSAFKIYLPTSTDKDIKEIIEDEIKQPIGGDETILVADDEPIMLSIIEKALIPL
ncbi:MAG: PAS domain S-box protein, partial [Proteobacteria bacterium]|nr:PAS domain S-box protein [Pseudomonadota bacterium]